MNIYKKFINYYKPYKRAFIIDMICALITSFVDLSIPFITSYLIREVFIIKDVELMFSIVLKYLLILLILYILKTITQFYVNCYGHIMGAKMETDMRLDLFTHLEKLSFSYYDKNNTGVMMSKIVADLFDVTELAHHGPEDVFISLIKIIGSLIILSGINFKITFVIFIIVVAMTAFSIKINKRVKKIFLDNREKIGNVNAVLQDSLSGIRVVKSFTNEDIELKKFEVGNKHFLSSKRRAYFNMGLYFSVNIFFQGLLYLSLFFLSAYFIKNKTMNPADIFIYVLYINMFLEPVNKLINFTVEMFQKGMTGFQRMVEVLETKPDILDCKSAIELVNVKGDIEFKNVSFQYDEEDGKIFKNISIKIPSGKTVALVGPSGAGKTTFCSLIPRFYETTEGIITIDNKNIKDIKLKSLRKSIGIVQQDVYIFNSSIKENIAYGKPEASFEEIIEASKKANIHDYIMSLENGYETMVGERGVRFSGGQKQRISIARVFLKNPPILILDEATSSLDNESEKFIQNSLEELSKNRTTIVIAHRLSTIRNADEILVLKDEAIKEKGNHDDLLKKDGIYASLYNMQFEKIN